MTNATVEHVIGDQLQAAREWLAQYWHGEDDAQWRQAVATSGYAVPTWPEDSFGLGLDRAQARDIAAVFVEAGAPGACQELEQASTHGWLHLLGGPLREYGTPEQKERMLPELLSGQMGTGCLLYSEPGAGSDLAGLQTKAVRDGDDYVINGQKVWTTGGHEAEFGMLLARTDWDVSKHAGISFFVFPMKQAGVDVQPIKQMTGDAEFNEVFLTDARVSADNLIGGEGNGWKVLQVALAAERRMMGESMQSGMAGAGEQDDSKSPIFGLSDDLIELARTAGRLDDPLVREEIIKIHSWRLVNDWNNARAVAELRTSGSSSLASLGKLAKSRILHSAAALRFRLLGIRGLQYDESQDAEAYRIDFDLMMSFINSIGGGSDQIQRNIISERVLRLPKGPEPDKGVPFRDVLKSDATRPLGK
jgi:alkylation response protein AidB-like acyl-CoA dehydrogenase